MVGHSRQTGVGELALQTLVRIKYAGLNSDQLDLILGKNLAPAVHRRETVGAENYGRHANLTTNKE